MQHLSLAKEVHPLCDAHRLLASFSSVRLVFDFMVFFDDISFVIRPFSISLFFIIVIDYSVMILIRSRIAFGFCSVHINR